jgi:hypothetical protein
MGIDNGMHDISGLEDYKVSHDNGIFYTKWELFA